jgi:hypothetical protein
MSFFSRLLGQQIFALIGDARIEAQQLGFVVTIKLFPQGYFSFLP